MTFNDKLEKLAAYFPPWSMGHSSLPSDWKNDPPPEGKKISFNSSPYQTEYFYYGEDGQPHDIDELPKEERAMIDISTHKAPMPRPRGRRRQPQATTTQPPPEPPQDKEGTAVEERRRLTFT